MFKVIKCLLVLSLIICIASCNANKNEIGINFSSDSTSIIINNIDEANFLQVKKLYSANPDTVNFLTVFTIPDVDDSLQLEKRFDGTIKLI